jgi:hypothetical protein
LINVLEKDNDSYHIHLDWWLMCVNPLSIDGDFFDHQRMKWKLGKCFEASMAWVLGFLNKFYFNVPLINQTQNKLRIFSIIGEYSRKNNLTYHPKGLVEQL